jgi:hypothetical protein
MFGGYALGRAYSPYDYGYDPYPPTYTIAQEPTVLVSSVQEHKNVQHYLFADVHLL